MKMKKKTYLNIITHLHPGWLGHALLRVYPKLRMIIKHRSPWQFFVTFLRWLIKWPFPRLSETPTSWSRKDLYNNACSDVLMQNAQQPLPTAECSRSPEDPNETCLMKSQHEDLITFLRRSIFQAETSLLYPWVNKHVYRTQHEN